MGGRFYRAVTEDKGQCVLEKPKPGVPGDGEPLEPKRICVAPTILQCLIGMAGWDLGHVWIYRTVNEVKAYKVRVEDVFDVVLTDEHWILEDCEFEQLGKYDLEALGVRFDEDDYYSLPGSGPVESIKAMVKYRDHLIRRLGCLVHPLPTIVESFHNAVTLLRRHGVVD